MELIFLGILVLTMVLALISGFPVAFALPGSAILTIGLAALTGYLFAGNPDAYFALDGPTQWLSAGVTNFRSLYWVVERDTLIAIPLFVFMGIMLQRSRIAEDLLVAMAQLFGPIPGGLGISVVFVGALLAATTGIVGATVIAMGLISLPAMLRNNYSKSLACGTICASGTLGQIIPPSIVLIILADQLASAADQASSLRKADFKEATGEFSMPSEFDIASASAGDMFMGALIPGLILVGLYMLYILISALVRPDSAPPVPYEGKLDRRFAIRIGMALIPPLALIFTVLGSIITGVATVNQAGAIGAIGALIMAGYRLPEKNHLRYVPASLSIISIVSIFLLTRAFDLNIKNIKNAQDQFGIYLAVLAVALLFVAIIWSAARVIRTHNTMGEVMRETAKTTSMVFIILLGAAMLTAAFRAFGGEELVRHYLTSLPGGFWTQFIVVMAVIFVLGFFLDFIEIAVVVVPIVAPILLADPSANITAVWLGVMIGLNIQTSFLTPPFGFALFYLRGVAPVSIKTTDIYKGAIAFIGLQLAGLAIAGYFPPLVNYLPFKTYLTSDNAPPPNNPRIQYCIEEDLLPQYAVLEPQFDRAITAIESSRMVDLPEGVRGDLTGLLDGYRQIPLMANAIDKRHMAVNEFLPEFDNNHQLSRQIRRQVNRYDDEISELNKLKADLRRSKAEPLKLEEVEQKIAAIEAEKEARIAEIPAEYDAQATQYRSLAQEEKNARATYRRQSDESYGALTTLIADISSVEALTELSPTVSGITAKIASMNNDEAMEHIKTVEQQLSDIAGGGKVKSLLSKARRALKGDSADRYESANLLDQASNQLSQDIHWRTSASSDVLNPLVHLEEISRHSVGLRSQPRLPKATASDIARCMSEHRDVSQSF